jgi:plasmid maintenance system antidote protein VapI
MKDIKAMLPELQKIRGVHPGAVLEREIKLRQIKKSEFAAKLGEYPAMLTDITKQRRSMPVKLAIRIAKELGAEEDYFVILQAYYEIEKVKKAEQKDAPKPIGLRRILFWDIDPEKIDYSKNRNFVIQRVFERGNETEIKEIIRFYGADNCISAIKKGKFFFNAHETKELVRQYLNIEI